MVRTSNLVLRGNLVVRPLPVAHHVNIVANSIRATAENTTPHNLFLAIVISSNLGATFQVNSPLFQHPNR